MRTFYKDFTFYLQGFCNTEIYVKQTLDIIIGGFKDYRFLVFLVFCLFNASYLAWFIIKVIIFLITNGTLRGRRPRDPKTK